MLARRTHRLFSVAPAQPDFVVERKVRQEAVALVRSRARSFYMASLFLPASIRRDVQIVYAYYRTVDDLVDEPPDGWTRDDIFEGLHRWEDGIHGRRNIRDPLCDALLHIGERHRIPAGYLTMVLDGARYDLDLCSVETREELIWYSVQVAGSVGMVMAHILGTRDDEALASACDLGVAMQLTNILRDVGEDLDRGRIYLPRADMERVGCSTGMLHARAVTPELRAVISSLSEEAHRLYGHGMGGIAHIDPSARFAIFLAATLYSRILDKVVQHDFDVFSRRAHLGTLEKWRLIAPTYARHRVCSLKL